MITKSNIAENIAGKLNITKQAAADAVDAVVLEIISSLRNREDVQLAGLGSLKVKDTAERMARNPQTKESIKVAAGRKVAFKVASTLKATI